MAWDYTPTSVVAGFQMEVSMNTNFSDIKTEGDKQLSRTSSVNNTENL